MERNIGGSAFRIPESYFWLQMAGDLAQPCSGEEPLPSGIEGAYIGQAFGILESALNRTAARRDF